MRRSVIFTIAALATTALAHADVYKSVDAKGEVSYSDVWSPGATLIKGLSVKNGQLTSEGNPSPPPVPSNDHTPDPSKQTAQSEVAHDLATTRAEQCQSLKDQYAKELRAHRIIRAGSSAENPQYLSDEEADAERVKTRQAMDEACGNTP